MKYYLYSYKPASKSGKALALSLGIPRIKNTGSSFKPKPTRTVINWGSSLLPFEPPSIYDIWNDPLHVRRMTNKIDALIVLEPHCRIPDWSDDKNDAMAWQAEGDAVMARKVLTGHSGQGIIYCGEEDEIPDAPLYTRYIKKAAEYRVHLFVDNPALFIQRKAKKDEVNNPNWKVRNLKGGFIYASDPENLGQVPPDVLTQARAAFEHSGLDFGAVDVIYNKKYNQAYVLEINTAPGLQGRTLEFYKATFTQLMNG